MLQHEPASRLLSQTTVLLQFRLPRKIFLSFGLFETLTLLIGNMPFLNVNDLQIALKGLLSYLRMVLKIKLFTVTKDERVFYNLDFVLVLF